MKLHVITNSELSLFKRCERAHYYRYRLLRAGDRSSKALSDGSSAHEFLEDWWLNKKEIRWPHDPGLKALCQGYDIRHVKIDKVLGVEKELSFTISEDIAIALKLDALVEIHGKLWVVEHKTSSQDTGAGSEYWQALRLDTQISTYVLACRVNGIDVEGVLYDVLNKTKLRPYTATPLATRKYKKDGTLYANQRAEDETENQFFSRVREDIAEDPDKYYKREFIRISEDEIEAAVPELITWAMRAQLNDDTSVRNSAGCLKFGRLCEYFPVCSKAISIETFPVLDRKHQELSIDVQE